MSDLVRHMPCGGDNWRTVQAACLALLLSVLVGCGTTRMSDSKRTATEQLLVSQAIDRAVMRIDVRPLAGRSVFLDTAFLDDVDDGKYLTSTLRQQLMASGCRLAKDRDTAEVVVEARAGAIGTDRSSVLLGIPATNFSVKGSETSTPELVLAKRSEQRGVAKLSVYAYERESGRPLWQSGDEQVASHARDRWLFGAGPYQDGEIHAEPEFAGRVIPKRGEKAGAAPPEPAALAGMVDLTKAQVFASQPTPSDAAPPSTDSVAERRPVDLPTVR
ncbi:MAG: hypothetical protein DWH79_02950 [Planctomycetota bacterium]|nr:MAG: hypothetical protein DWH79_02950 [Planctomycetota bacterium]